MFDFLTSLGARAERRMTPRVGVALAGAGGLIAVFGALGIGGDQLLTDDGDIRRIPGVLVTLLMIAVGLGLLTRVRSGPIATGATVLAAVGVPALVFFLTVDDSGDFPPFSFDAVVFVSMAVWLALYVVGPARGRLFLLALGLVAAPLFVMEQVEEISTVPEAIGEAFLYGFSAGTTSEEDFTVDEDGNVVVEDEFGEDMTEDELEEPDLPDPTNLGVIALVFGALYVGAGHVLSRRGLLGAGTPPTVLGALLLPLGIAFVADDLGDSPSGVALLVIGAVLLFAGATSGRRFTTWGGAAAFGVGVTVILGDVLPEDASTMTVSLVALVVGAAVVLAGHTLASAIGEPAEEDQRRTLRPEMEEAGLDEPGPPPDDSVWQPPTST